MHLIRLLPIHPMFASFVFPLKRYILKIELTGFRLLSSHLMFVSFVFPLKMYILKI
jgi:hypothetical protein